MAKFFIFLLVLVYWPTAQANRITVAPGVLDFGYKEVDGNNQTLNRETGYLQGIDISGVFALTPVLSMEPVIRAYTGSVDYDGATQIGNALQTETEQDIWLYGATLARHWGNNKAWLFNVNYAVWQRDIQPTANVAGLFEEYTWWEVGLGFRHQFLLNPRNTLSYQVTAFYLPHAEVTADLSVIGAGDVELEQGSGRGIRLGASWEHKLTADFFTGIGLVYDARQVDASESKRVLTSRGITLIQEPEGRTENTALQFFLGFQF